MKARKRNRPAEWPDTTIKYRYAVLSRVREYWNQIGVIMAVSLIEAKAKAMFQFARVKDTKVMFWDDWAAFDADQYARCTKPQTTQHPPDEPRASKPAPQSPSPTEAERIAANREYERLKAAYYAGEPMKITDKLKAQFDAFPPNQRVIGPMAGECETKHRTKPINKQKWRPLQSGFCVTEACKIMEHESDNDHETA